MIVLPVLLVAIIGVGSVRVISLISVQENISMSDSHHIIKPTDKEETHECPKAQNNNIIFYSRLWKAWSLKIFYSVPEANADPIFIIIVYCPYCGVKLE